VLQRPAIVPEGFRTAAVSIYCWHRAAAITRAIKNIVAWSELSLNTAMTTRFKTEAMHGERDMLLARRIGVVTSAQLKS
jgi:hypothetical protein